MYSQTAKTLIGIAVGHLLPNKYAWVSEAEEGPFHVETTASAGKGGETFNALCGAFGSFMAHRTAKQVISSEKCQTCKELSTTGIQDVADQGRGTAPFTESITDSKGGGAQEPSASPLESLINRLIPETLPDADLCHCGQPATLTCPCGAKVCVAHLYDGEGQHVEAQGFCCDCVDLIQAEQHGIERCGRAEAR